VQRDLKTSMLLVKCVSKLPSCSDLLPVATHSMDLHQDMQPVQVWLVQDAGVCLESYISGTANRN
jgi:hypothetical protein